MTQNEQLLETKKLLISQISVSNDKVEAMVLKFSSLQKQNSDLSQKIVQHISTIQQL